MFATYSIVGTITAKKTSGQDEIRPRCTRLKSTK